MNRHCEISGCGKYRYSLSENSTSGHGRIVWIMLNPSTADGIDDDPTIRKVRGFSEREGCAKWTVVNLFAFRAADQRVCKKALIAGEAVGPLNDMHILAEASYATALVLAWGPKPWAYARAGAVIQLLGTRLRESSLPPFYCIREAKDGAPVHPLMQPYALGLRRFRP